MAKDTNHIGLLKLICYENMSWENISGAGVGGLKTLQKKKSLHLKKKTIDYRECGWKQGKWKGSANFAPIQARKHEFGTRVVAVEEVSNREPLNIF